MSLSIIKRIEAIGWAVSVHRIPSSLLGTVGEFVELHAVNVTTAEVKITRCTDGNGPDETYRSACALAEMVGIRLEG